MAGWLVALVVLGWPLATRAAELELAPLSGVEDGLFQVIQIDGMPHHQVLDWNGNPALYLYYTVPPGFAVTGRPLYVQVFYREDGLGTLGVHYDSSMTTGTLEERAYRQSEEAYGTLYANGGGEREAVFMLQMPGLLGRQNGGADLRLMGSLAVPARLTVRKVVLWDVAPPLFAANAQKPWLEPYVGPSRSDIDTASLDGKVLCGYQGWFNTPDDGVEMGYRHWSRDPFRVAPGTITVDYWPEVTQYDPGDLYTAAGMTLPDGSPAQLYSAFKRGPVLRHFQWMSQYGIDGVFLSRFISETINPKSFRHFNMVLNHVREGCHREGRTWAMMYDLSGNWPNMGPADVIKDWKFLCDQVHIREDSRYQRHNGQPVMLLWGLGFQDRAWTAAQAAELIDFFKNDPVYGGVWLIGGVDPYWRTLGGTSRPEPEWTAIYQSFDAISPWDAGRYSDLINMVTFRLNVWAPDLALLNSLGKGYMPTVFPGFSWDNLMNNPPGTSRIPRRGGDFYWKQFYHLKSLGVKTVFVGMFDEVDEGTAIYKVTNAPPVENFFMTYEGLPSDWYLKLTGMGTRMMRGEIPLSATMPSEIPFPVYTSESRTWTVYQ